ncbi:MAG: hypothetical protein COB36_02160 [Alphaproteobacteria bacterium]|nr:MAG: hypothetical protein COB36_02160 [Alphaproteobacteria bacterium]
MISDEYLQTVLMLLGVPENLFSVASPLSVLFVYIFSTRILVFILSIVIWAMLFLFKSRYDVGIKQQTKVREKHSKTHRYDMKDPFKMEKIKKPSLLGMAMRGVILPIMVIFIALSVAMSIVNV